MMANLALAEGDIVVLRNVQIPKAQFVRFRPHSKASREAGMGMHGGEGHAT